MGSASGLHIIIFDEIDAICKERGTVVSSVCYVYTKVMSCNIYVQSCSQPKFVASLFKFEHEGARVY